MADESDLTVPQRQHAPKGPIKARDPMKRGIPIKNQCTAKAKLTGQRCARAAIAGGRVCRVHGGAAPHVKAAARERLRALVEPALTAYDELIQQDKFPTVRFATAREVVNHEFGRPGESLDLNVSVNVDVEIVARLEQWRQYNAGRDESK